MKNGVRAITQKDIRWDNCFIKSLNLLPNVLAKQAAYEKNCYEAILHKDGLVTEGSSSNVYLVKDNSIYTHPATIHILCGCVRLSVEKFAKELNIAFIEEPFDINDIKKANELFLTSSTSEVMPIISVNDQLIKDGVPGKITRLLQRAFEYDTKIKPHKT